jgi:hypothetical protein
MITDLQLDDKAPWKERFRAPVVAWTQIARANPTRGLAVTNSSGKNQLYAWMCLPVRYVSSPTDPPESSLGKFRGMVATPRDHFASQLLRIQGKDRLAGDCGNSACDCRSRNFIPGVI